MGKEETSASHPETQAVGKEVTSELHPETQAVGKEATLESEAQALVSAPWLTY